MRKNTIAFASIFLLLTILTSTAIIEQLSYFIKELIKMW